MKTSEERCEVLKISSWPTDLSPMESRHGTLERAISIGRLDAGTNEAFFMGYRHIPPPNIILSPNQSKLGDPTNDTSGTVTAISTSP